VEPFFRCLELLADNYYRDLSIFRFEADSFFCFSGHFLFYDVHDCRLSTRTAPKISRTRQPKLLLLL